jgi:hypothetical protein
MTDSIEDFAQEYMAAQKACWENDDVTGLAALEHRDVLFSNINGTVFEGREAHFAAIEGMKASFGGVPITQDWRFLMASGSIFSLSYQWTIATPGAPTRIDGILVGRVDGGQLVEEWGANYAVER